jgi:pimeloyl-ACP methyl ester carboxylesterase
MHLILVLACTTVPASAPTLPPSRAPDPLETADTGPRPASTPLLPPLALDVPLAPGFPHLVDHLRPTEVTADTTAIVLLHGGGGTKHQVVYSLGIKTDDTPSYATGYDAAYLDAHDIALIVPQGQAVPEHPGATTWSNTIMTSGQDDLAALTALADTLRDEGYGRVVLMGHSMGGSMANRFWCEAPAVFDAYGSSAGPRSNDVDATCAPTVFRPYLHVTGMNDRVIQLVEDRPGALPDLAHHDAETLTLDDRARVLSSGAFVHAPPEFRNELSSFDDRVTAMCAEPGPLPVDAPPTDDWDTRTYTACDGDLQMVLLADRDHCLGGEDAAGGYLCDVPLTPWGTTAHLDRFVGFFTR